MSISDLFNPTLLSKYNINGPRYTSYPTALEFGEIADAEPLLSALSQSKTKGLSIYIHIPFCHQLCYYCGCNKIVTRHREKADRYLDYLEIEIQQRAKHFSLHQVQQIHLGGGTPSFLTETQQVRLMDLLNTHFTIAENAEIGIEVDPRRMTTTHLKHLASLGYNRLSIGVQDTDYKVQKAINRVQSTEHVAHLTQFAQKNGFKSVNLDLIYGLPHQTPETFAKTLLDVKKMRPERISLFSYAHLPARFAAQRKIKDHWLPSAVEKTQLMKQAMKSLTEIGYVLIGMDHFSLPTDELAVAQEKGQLHRNFQGYTTGGDLDLLGLGVSSISAVGNGYLQNPKTLNSYYGKLDNQQDPTEKGVFLTDEDLLRRYIIQQLMCNLSLSFADVEERFHIDFHAQFASELMTLREFEQDGILQISSTGITVAKHARLFIRIVCMTFDSYLQNESNKHRYSRVI
ncbi:oxygen-independent coproporphyrinogen III oxidase [Alteromonas sp. 14N.309.X.WAT.G.H12]|uniref:oxygen-independent coproporphyrinogen III oxidase n=1 Tax=Alteromonas sp. 14N.309.X.WAT.G.H12 TaxID=3120824 RepID=UPI002FD29082